MTRDNSPSRVLAQAIVCLFFFAGCALKTGKQPRREIAPLYSASAPEFRQAAGSLLGSDFLPGNSIATLVNGHQIFPSMLSAIHSAKHSINFETYFFVDGQIANQFSGALAERARPGSKSTPSSTLRAPRKWECKIWNNSATPESRS